MLQHNTVYLPAFLVHHYTGASCFTGIKSVYKCELQNRDAYPVFLSLTPGNLKERKTQINIAESVEHTPSAT